MRTNALSHITYATEWPFVRAAFIASVVLDGETFEKPTEREFSSEPVMQAVVALEQAILAELGAMQNPDGTPTTASVTTLREVNEARNQAAAKEAVRRLAEEWDKANPSPTARYDENGVRVDAPPELRGVAGDETARPAIPSSPGNPVPR